MEKTLTLTFFLISSIGLAAAQAPAPAPAKPEDLCRLEGRITDAITGEPVKKASLQLSRTDVPRTPGAVALPQVFSTSSDAAGRFAMKDLEPGSYRLQATRTGYVPSEYGEKSPTSASAVLTLSRGQDLKNIDLHLTPHGVVSGRIVDESGEPMPSVMVQLLKQQYSKGKKQLTTAGSGQTNDLGEYRIFGLPPGRYYASAGMQVMSALPAVDRSAVPPPDEDYVPTLYPGTRDGSAATPIDVTAGSVTPRVDMALVKTHTVTIRGSVNPPGAAPLLILAPRSLAGTLSLKMVMVNPRGEFEVRGVGPGAYSLTGSTKQNGKTATVSLPVNVGSSNIDNLVFAAGVGFTVSGRIAVEGEATAELSKARVALQAREMGIGSLVAALGAVLSGAMPGEAVGKLEKDLSFKMDDVSPDLYEVTVTGLPEGFYVKSIRCGETDALISGLALSGPPEPIEIVVSPKAGQIAGAVRNPKTQQPEPNVTLALVPQEAARRETQIYYRNVSTDAAGNFTLKSLPPGEYRVYAWEDVEDGAWMDPEFMKPLESKGVPVTLKESGNETVQVQAIAAEGKKG